MSEPGATPAPVSDFSPTCTCQVVYIGLRESPARNWNPLCSDHGLASPWYNSPAQIERRANQISQLRGLQVRARDARAATS